MSIYGCFNKPRPEYGAPLLVQQGWNQMRGVADDGTIGQLTRMVEIPYVMSTKCQYTLSHTSDPQCAGCIHKNEGGT